MTQTYIQKVWSLTDLFSAREGDEMKTAFDELEALVADFESHRDSLSADTPAENFLGIIRDLEVITELGNRIYYYAGLDFAADTQSQEAQAFQAQADQLMATMGNRTLFFSLWWKGLDDEAAERLMEASGDYRYWLEEMRNFKPHTLTEAEEKIINIKDVTGANALNTLYDSITNRYAYKVTVEGEELELTRGELMVHVRSQDPDLRAAAYQ